MLPYSPLKGVSKEAPAVKTFLLSTAIGYGLHRKQECRERGFYNGKERLWNTEFLQL